ncbi:unnamed protein product, partial [Aphanomyces euteiches]
PGQCIPIPEDLSTTAGCKRLVAALQQRESKLDVLINNSGIGWAGGVHAHDEDTWSKILNLNLSTPFFLTKFLLPLLQTNARVINIGSISGIVPNKLGSTAYDTSKAALHHLTKALAAELAPLRITVNSISPGLTVTFRFDEMAAQDIPLRRPGLPTDLAGAAIFLASPAAAWITGGILVVDGGQVNAITSGGAFASA